MLPPMTCLSAVRGRLILRMQHASGISELRRGGARREKEIRRLGRGLGERRRKWCSRAARNCREPRSLGPDLTAQVAGGEGQWSLSSAAASWNAHSALIKQPDSSRGARVGRSSWLSSVSKAGQRLLEQLERPGDWRTSLYRSMAGSERGHELGREGPSSVAKQPVAVEWPSECRDSSSAPGSRLGRARFDLSLGRLPLSLSAARVSEGGTGGGAGAGWRTSSALIRLGLRPGRPF